MTINTFGVFGQPAPGYIPGKWINSTSVSNDYAHSVGSTRFGQRCELRIIKQNPADPEVLVRVCASAQDTEWDRRAEGGVIISSESPPLEIYDPLGGAAVAVKKVYPGASNFIAELYSTDGSNSKGSFPPMVVNEGSADPPAATSVVLALDVTVPLKPALANDLLLAWIGVGGGSPPPITAPGGWRYIGVIFSGADPEVHCYCKLATGAEPPNYTWADGSGSPAPRHWSGVLKLLRAEGATDLEAYGLGFLAYGVPSLSKTAKHDVATGVIADTPFGPVQYAALDPVADMAYVAQPFLACCCFATYAGSNPGPSTFQTANSLSSLVPSITTRASNSELRATSMLAVGEFIVPGPQLQPTAYQLFPSTPPWAWQGVVLGLGKI